MKENWERSVPVVELSRMEVDALIQSSFPGKRVDRFQLVEGGFANTSYKLELSGGGLPLFLRIYTKSAQGGTAGKERALAELLAGKVPISRFLDFHESNPVTGHAYALQEWIDGVTLARTLPNAADGDLAEIGLHLGEVLARISSFTFQTSGLLDGELRVAQPIPMGSEGFLAFNHQTILEGNASALLGEELTAELWAFLDANAAVLDSVEVQNCLVHGDFDSLNILVRKENGGWRIAGIVDWEFAFSGSAVFDLGHILRPPLGDRAAFEESLIRGYTKSDGKLPECWKRAGKLADLSAWIDFLSRPNPLETVVATSREMILRTMRCWETC